VRKPTSPSALALIKARYFKYPKVYDLMLNRHNVYNETLDYIERQKLSGQAFVIRPKKKSNVGRLEKDREKLIALYWEGYEDAKEQFEAMINYLESDISDDM
jgi:predicted patatin/cPLA2 family phospholipase